MGKSGGLITQVLGFVLTVTGMIMNAVVPGSGTPFMAAGMAMMFGGSIWASDSARRDAHEAMDRMKRQSGGMKANTRTTQRSIPVPYGRVRVGGNIVYMRATGANNNDLHLVYGVGEGPVDGFEEVWFDNVKVWDVASCTSQVDSADNGKIDGPYKDWFSVSFRFGTNSQATFWQINSAGDVDFQDQYPLLAAAYLKLIYNQNVYQHLPQVNFVLRGRTITDNSTPTVPVTWNDNPVNVLYDEQVDQRYGWGLPSSKINWASVHSAAVYANGSCAVFADYMQETVDRHDMPLAWTGTQKHWSTVSPGYVAIDIGKIGAPSQTGITPTYFVSRLPISPGSVYISFWSNIGAVTVTDTFATTNPSTGALYSGTSPYGSINYRTGIASLDSYGYNVDDSGTQIPVERTVTVNWIADYEYAYRTAYKFLARSVYSYVGSEFFTETASAVLASNSGGTGTVDYTNGVVTLKPRGPAYLAGEQPRVYYKVQTATGMKRFSYNGLLLDTQKAIDVFRETATHFRGFIVYTNGQYYYNSDGPGSSIYSFNDDNIIAGTFKIQQAPISDRPNRIRVKYIDAAMNYSPSDILYETDSPAVVVADQRELTLELPGVVYRDAAHRMGQTLANQVALGNNIEFQTTLDAAAVYPGNIIDVTHPSAAWSGKLFRVYETNEAQDGGMSIKAVEHSDSVYADAWQFGKPAEFTPSFFPTRNYFPPAVTSLSLREIPQTLSDGTTTPMLEVTAEALATSATVGGYKFWLAEASTSSKATQLLYSGPSNKYAAHVKPGQYSVTAFTYSEFDPNVLSAKGITGYAQVTGNPQYDALRWRLERNAAGTTFGNGAQTEDMINVASWGVTSGTPCAFMSYVMSTGTYPKDINLVRLWQGNSVYAGKVTCVGCGETPGVVGMGINSGDQPIIAYTQNNALAGVTTTCGVTLSKSFSVINTIAPFGGGTCYRDVCVLANPSGYMMFFGQNYGSSGGTATRKIDFMPTSTNLSTGVSTSIITSSLVAGTDALSNCSFQAVRVNSYIYGLYYYSVAPTGLTALAVFKWNHDVTSCYIAGSKWFVDASSPAYGGVIRAAFDPVDDNRIAMVFSRFKWIDGVVGYGNHVAILDVRTVGSFRVWKMSDYAEAAGTWGGYWDGMGHPIVDGKNIHTAKIKEGALGSTVIDYDIFTQYSVSSFSDRMSW